MFKPVSLLKAHAAHAALAMMAVLMWQAPPASAQLAAGAAAASAPAEPRLATQLVLAKVVTEGTAEKLTPVASVQPGDLLQYTAHFGNPTAAALRDVVPSLPVPAGTQWQPRGDMPTGATASVDGRNFGPLPLMRKQLQASGQWVQVPVPLSEIRVLRWPARSLGVGESFATSLRVRVLSTDAVNAALAAPSTTASVVLPVVSDPGRTQVAGR